MGAGGTRSSAARALAALGRGIAALVLFVLVLLLILRAAASVRENATAAPAGTVKFQTSTGAVAARVEGPADGPIIVVVHGTAAWGGFWKDVSAHLSSRGWRVIAVDLPPFGWSQRDPEARYDRVSQAERLAAVIAAQHKPALVLAHSFGAGPATELTLRHPSLVRGLVLVDAALGELDARSESLAASLFGLRPVAELTISATITSPNALEPLLRSLLQRKEAAKPWLAVLRDPMRREGTTSAYAAWLPNLFTREDGALSRRSANLRTIRVPVALIWGSADHVTPLGQGKTLAELVRTRSLTILSGVGHIPHIEDPVSFDVALDRALSSLTEPKK